MSPERPGPADLVVTSAEDQHAVVVTVSGEVDLFTVPRLDAELVEATSSGVPALLVDLRAVTFIDSAGLGVLVAAFKRCRAHRGAMHLVVTSREVRRLLEVLGLDAVLPVHAGLDEALAAAAPGRPS